MIQVWHMMCLWLTQAFLARRIMIYSNNKTLHNLTITLPSDVDEKELGISLDQNIRFHPNITRDGYFLLLRMRTSYLSWKGARMLSMKWTTHISRAYINTLEEALAKWQELVDKKDFSTATEIEAQVFKEVAAIFTDYIKHVYRTDTPDNAKYFFTYFKSFPSFDTAKQYAKDGGTYIAKPSSILPPKFGTSLTDCLQRTNRQSIKK